MSLLRQNNQPFFDKTFVNEELCNHTHEEKNLNLLNLAYGLQ